MMGLRSRVQDKKLVAVVPGEGGLGVVTLGEGKGDIPQLTTCEFTPWESGAADPQLLSAKVKTHRVDRRPCTTVMDIGDYMILSVEAPDVPPAELRAAVRWQIKDLIDFHVDDAIVDVFDAPASGAHGRQNNLYVVVSRTAKVRERVDALQGASANLTTIDIPELVFRNITARLPEDQAGVVFVYLTRERGLIIVTRQSTLYLARTLDIGYEYLRRGLGDAESGLGLGLEGQFDQLVLEVQRSLDYYDRYFVQPPVAGLVLAPTEQEIPGLLEYLHSNLGLKCRQLDINEIVATPAPLDPRLQAQCLPAIGAVLREERAAL